MRAGRFDSTTGRFSVETIPVPEPGPGEVLVRVAACGICLSDVHLLDGGLRASEPVITPGHEAAGTIARLGSDVPSWQVGDRVVMAGGMRCGDCPVCAGGGNEADCPDAMIMGFDFDGAWAEYIVVPYSSLTAVPDGLPFEQAAILADAVATPYAGLIRRAALRPGESIGLWGIGGLGVHAVQLARLVGAAPIVAIDPNPAARERALAAGADAVLDPTTDDVPADIARLTGDSGLDVAVDLVGTNEVVKQGGRCLGRYGRLLLIGMSREKIELGPAVLFNSLSQSLLGHLGYTKRDLDQVVALVRTGRLDVSRSISGTLPLEDVEDGVRQLANKDGNPIRLVVIP